YWAAEESPLYALQNYTTAGDYLNYGTWNRLNPTPDFRFDGDGYPMVRYNGVFYFNPVNVADYALIQYGRMLGGELVAADFLRIADLLITLQDSRGAFLYPFRYPYYLTGEVLPVGWTSGMAQGMGMSVMARAYIVTNDAKYLAAGDSALQYLLTHETTGGPAGDLSDLDPALAGLLSLKEFPSTPDYYTLNGFMYTMLGLYDWWQLPREGAGPPETARVTFHRAVQTLLYTLPYYDVGGFSAYDLGHIIAGVRPNLQAEYHNIHIYLLHALHSITGEQRLQCFEELWYSYVKR
ncbi:MAG: D-glucuronyl C5-epimerase family protein, partial [Tepidiformaceae bacterium]